MQVAPIATLLGRPLWEKQLLGLEWWGCSIEVVASMVIDFVCHRSAAYIGIIDVILAAVHPPRTYDLPTGVGSSFSYGNSDPYLVAEILKLLLHCQAIMAHRQFLEGVLIFVDLVEHQIGMLNICPS